MMTLSNACISKQINVFCSKIGADPLLVQGAGGNVSWKDGDVLWVKASGTWLADAELKDIFVPVNLSHLRQAIFNQDFSVSPEIISSSTLRPSIETLLHALMPHKVVAHLHAVEILAHLVREKAKENITNLVGSSVKWIYVDYYKPGADLAKAIHQQLTSSPSSEVVFLGNHGVVIGGDDIEEVESKLHFLISILQTRSTQSSPKTAQSTLDSECLAKGYVPCCDKEVNELVHKEELAARLRTEWALYPDHVVFLGATPAIINMNFKSHELDELASQKPPFIFAIGTGVYEGLHATPAQKSQLRCYYDVIIRQSDSIKLLTLNHHQIYELLNWDAEKYRQNPTKISIGAV